MAFTEKSKRFGAVSLLSLILAVIISCAIRIGVRPFGDGVTYYSMVESLIKDGDLILDNKEISRWKYSRFENFPVGASLVIDDRGTMRYGKPILYPLLAAPFFLLFGNTGFVLLNGLFLCGCIAACCSYLKKYFKSNDSLFIAAAFFLCSFMPAYVVWMHPEMMLFFACALCMWLWLNKNKTALSALVIGIAGSVKITFLLLLIPLIIVLLSKQKFKELSRAVGICFLGIGFISVLTFFLLGRVSAYSGVSGLISPGVFAYLTTEEIKKTLTIIPSHLIGIEFNSWGLFFRNILYFFIGRFTGIIWYAFPGAVCAGIYLSYRRRIKRPERILGDTILTASLLLVAILIIARPLSYFGGEDFICNRYFFILPSLLFLPAVRLIKKPKLVVLLFLPGLLISSPIIKNEVLFRTWYHRYGRDAHVFPQVAHTRSFPLKYAPLEIPQVEAFFIYSLKISDNLFFYFPSGLRKQVDKKIIMDAGQEIVIVKGNSVDYLKLQTEQGEVVLQPRVILNSKTSAKQKSFYYFKAIQPTWVNVNK